MVANSSWPLAGDGEVRLLYPGWETSDNLVTESEEGRDISRVQGLTPPPKASIVSRGNCLRSLKTTLWRYLGHPQAPVEGWHAYFSLSN